MEAGLCWGGAPDARTPDIQFRVGVRRSHMSTTGTLVLPSDSTPAKMTVEVVSSPRMLDIIIVLVIVVVLVVALGYSSQFLELLNSGKSEALSRLVSGDMRETFRSMNIAVVVITVILLAAIISAFIASAVKSSETAAQVQSRRPGSY